MTWARLREGEAGLRGGVEDPSATSQPQTILGKLDGRSEGGLSLSLKREGLTFCPTPLTFRPDLRLRSGGFHFGRGPQTGFPLS